MSVVHAALPDTGLQQTATPLSDDRLSEIRGKFITAESVSYFGVQMASSWQGADGITTNATLLFAVDFAAGAGSQGVPILMINWSRDGDPAMDLDAFASAASGGYVVLSGGQVVVPTNSLNGVSGVVQSNVIAGTDNQVRNGMSIAVVPKDQIPGLLAAGLQPASGSTTVTLDDGSTIDFSVANNGVGLALTRNGNSVAQGVDGTLGRAAQNIVLNSNLNRIENNMTMMIGVDTLQQIDTIRFQEALWSIKGI
ncbi:hypothetical protein [Sphingomonas xanthus]|uniref:Uncharacterized protein n=1 Tax=Sphingomonas xanthus TaxID=2594473 RepID=A0A516INL4_9SPHN|nr:hypothetical protein [Sphingomonas xanthus]QDP18498.1 hypothetical protein FMM02_00100 [Sphingomonas xanthus]